jgi:CrcB protein
VRIVVSIAIGGAFGALLRYALSGWVYDLLGQEFPWGTLAINLIGCFLIGFLWQWFEGAIVPPYLRTLLITGGLGAFTTFSTYGVETLNLMRDGEWKFSFLNIALSNVLGIFLVYLGFVVARLVFGR